MRVVITVLILMVAMSIYGQTERFVDLYNQGHITVTELESLILSNVYRPDTTIIAKTAQYEPNYLLSSFSQSTYGTSAVSPLVVKYIKDFWGFISKTIFYRQPNCDTSLKDCKEMIQEFQKLNLQMKNGN